MRNCVARIFFCGGGRRRMGGMGGRFGTNFNLLGRGGEGWRYRGGAGVEVIDGEKGWR